MKTTLQKGFTLIEAMIVLAIVGAVAVISLDMLTGAAKGEARRSMISQQATEMATLNRAVNEWVRTATALPTAAGAVMEVTLQDVITAGRLPAQFANRAASGSTLPTSPLGQQYRAFIRRTAGSRFEVVVFPAGAQNPGFAARAGVVQDPEAMRVWNVAVMQEVRQKHSLPAGVVNQGATAVDSAASGFTINLADFIGGPATASTVAALSNFAALETVAAAATPPQGNSFIGKTCRIDTTAAPCASDETLVTEHSVCATTGAEFLDVSQASELKITPIGNMQITRQVWNNAPQAMYGTSLVSTRGISATIERMFETWAGQDPNTGQTLWDVTCRHIPSGRTFLCVERSPTHWEWAQHLVLPSSAELIGHEMTNNSVALWAPVSQFRETFAPQQIALDNSVNITRTGAKVACGGAFSAPMPIWDASIRFVGTPSLRVLPVQIASMTRPTSGPTIRSSHHETVTLPGLPPISQICEENLISNAATVGIGLVHGQSSVATGVNSCPMSAPPLNTQTFNGQAVQRPWERFRRRVNSADMTTLKICCK